MLPQPVKKDPQRAGGGDAGVKLAQRAGGGVAGVGEERFIMLAAQVVHRFKIGPVDIYFAAHLYSDRFGQPQRDLLDCAEVMGDLFPGKAVPPGGAADKTALFILQRNSEPVYLQLAKVVNGVKPRQPPHSAVEIVQLFRQESIVQAEHGQLVGQGGKPRQRRPAHAPGRGIISLQLGKPLFQPDQLAHQRVKFMIADHRFIEHMVAVVMLLDLPAQLRGPDSRLFPVLFTHGCLNLPSL